MCCLFFTRFCKIYVSISEYKSRWKFCNYKTSSFQLEKRPSTFHCKHLLWPTAAHHGQVTPKRITWVRGTGSGSSFWWRINRLQLKSEGVRKHVVSRFEFLKCLRCLANLRNYRGKLCFVVASRYQVDRLWFAQLKALLGLCLGFIICCYGIFLVKDLVITGKEHKSLFVDVKDLIYNRLNIWEKHCKRHVILLLQP